MVTIPLGGEFDRRIERDTGDFPEKVVRQIILADQVRKRVLSLFESDEKSNKILKREIGTHCEEARIRNPFVSSAITPEQIHDYVSRFVNDDLLRRVLFADYADNMNDIDVLTCIINMQISRAFVQNQADQRIFRPVPEKILRDKGIEVATSRSVILPFVRGEFARESLREILQEMETEFVQLGTEEAILKGCLYFYLILILHPQHDFNGRVSRYFINHKIHQATKHQIPEKDYKKRLTLGKGPFGDRDTAFIESIIRPIDERVRAELVFTFLPQLQSSPYARYFIEALWPLISRHSYDWMDPRFEEVYTGSEWSPQPEHRICDATGFTREGIEWLYSEADKNDLEDDELEELFGIDENHERSKTFARQFRTLKCYIKDKKIGEILSVDEFYESLEQLFELYKNKEYYQLIRKIIHSVQEYLMQKVFPVLKRMSEEDDGTGEIFQRYHYVNYYVEMYGERVDLQYIEFVDMVLYGLRKYQIPVKYSPFITKVIKEMIDFTL